METAKLDEEKRNRVNLRSHQPRITAGVEYKFYSFAITVKQIKVNKFLSLLTALRFLLIQMSVGVSLVIIFRQLNFLYDQTVFADIPA